MAFNPLYDEEADVAVQVLGLMRALRNHVKTWGLRINLVAPGITESNMTTKALERFKELNMYRQSPEEVSLAFGYLVSNEEVNGKTIYVNGGKYRELEDTYSVKLKSDVLGPDDFGPKTEDEFAAVVELLDTHW